MGIIQIIIVIAWASLQELSYACIFMSEAIGPYEISDKYRLYVCVLNMCARSI